MRCPMSIDMSNQLAPCDRECAWLMDMREEPGTKACAVAVSASKVRTMLGGFEPKRYVLPANVVQEGADE